MLDSLPIEAILAEELPRFTHDPLAFVLYAFPWGEPGSELEHETGPDQWQIDTLTEVRDNIPNLKSLGEVLRFATASGNGIGKSALVAWLLLWAVSTHEDTRGVVTANTETQLTTKTWAELAKWYRLFIGRSLFKFTATALFSIDPDHEKTWRIDMIPWSERNPEAFAGMHNLTKRIILVFDEASAIADIIWETAEGALTDKNTEIMWFAFGNPTKNTGKFYECFHTQRHRWRHRSIDSRTVRISNKNLLQEWLDDYTEDSDFFRIHVRGEFPRHGALEFISAEDVRFAQAREVSPFPFDPLILGVDVARYGDDSTILYTRRGRDGRSTPYVTLRQVDTMVVAGRVAEEHAKHRYDAIFVDAGGVGGGVVDRLRQLRIPVWPIDFGSRPDNINFDEKILYANKRAEIWGAMRRWLKDGGIPATRDLEVQLLAPQYFYNNANAILLEAKKDMKRRGVASPDIADALALTFAFPVGERAFNAGAKSKHQIDFDPFADAWRGVPT